MPTFKKNTSPAMKRSAYKMKYSNSAFPFKSPLKDHEKDKDGNVIEHKDSKKEALSNVANFILDEITPDSTTVKKMKTEITSKPKGKDAMKSLLDDL